MVNHTRQIPELHINYDKEHVNTEPDTSDNSKIDESKNYEGNSIPEYGVWKI